MSRKRTKKQAEEKAPDQEEKRKGRPKGKSRTAAVLSVVSTDSTFYLHDDQVSPAVWVGKCIHCNRKLAVTESGSTGATLEHIVPLCAGGSADDPRNLALACVGCNNRKGIDHDMHVGVRTRSDEVVTALQGRRLARWREPVKVRTWVE